MPDLLLELFSEEIPARMQQRAARDLERMMNDRLIAAGFLPEGVKAFAGPRRLALIATGLPVRQPDRKEEKKGPRVGAPEKAVEGFLKSAGLSSLDQCEIVEDKKGPYYVARIEEKGLPTSAILAEAVPAIVRDFPWPKAMRWGDGDLRWVRPLKSVLCCFADEIVPFEIDGVKAGDRTMGHRRYSYGPIHARNFDKYVPALTNAKVILDGKAREELIAADAKTLCEAQGLELVEDKGLLAEVSGLAEWPVVMMGAFDKKFLALPDEVLTASMRGHQKYFSVKDPKTGRLANKFVFVANIDAPDAGKSMRAGYERVLTARLSDAWYLYHQDLKLWTSRQSIDEYVEPLERVTFFEGLGTIGDKARRIAALARAIAPAVGADPALAEKAALLAKADLTTGMVYEFPELQGFMGRYYYLAQHSSHLSRKAGVGDDAVADAIRDHYKPQGADDDVPTAPVSVAVALADKIDTLTAFWVIEKKPTGSSDPFALRRAALGYVQCVLRNGVRPDLRISVARVVFDLIRQLRPRTGYNAFDQVPDAEDIARGAATPELPDVFAQPYRLFVGYQGFFDENESLIQAALAGDHDLDLDRPEDQGINGRRQGARSTYRNRLNALDSLLNGFRWIGRGNDPSAQLSELLRGEALAGPLDELYPQVLAFFHDRLKVYLKDKGHKYDAIDAVLTKADGTLEDDLVLIVRKLEALEAFLKTDDGANLAAGYKRAANILKAEEKKGKLPEASAVDEKLLAQAEEKALFAALKSAEEKAAKAVAAEKFADAMTALASLRSAVDAFFDKVTVNADDAKLRANRLALLQRFVAATAAVADLGKLEG